MPDVPSLLNGRRSNVTRPANYEELMLEPIVDDATTAKTAFGSYLGWEADHWHDRRFYVAGIRWFQRATNVTQQTLESYRAAARKFVVDHDDWQNPNEPSARWDDDFGRPQVLDAWNKRPVTFGSAARVLVACELCVKDLIEKNGVTVPGITTPQEIYGRMAIMPAVWNIANWGKDFIAEADQLHPDFYASLMNDAHLDNTAVIADLANGFTITHDTANRIRAHAKQAVRNPFGRVRAKPGSYVGAGPATTNEEVDLG